MVPWVNEGFLFAVSIYLQGEWVDFLSVYVPQIDDGLALRQDLHLFMLNHGHSKVAICSDFNCPVTELSHGLFSSRALFRSLAFEAHDDLTTFKSHSKGVDSVTAIDDILLSSSLAEHCAPCASVFPRPLGHAAVLASLHLSSSHSAEYTLVLPDKASLADVTLDWHSDLAVTDDWHFFCANLDSLYSNENRPRGSPPLFVLGMSLPKINCVRLSLLPLGSRITKLWEFFWTLLASVMRVILSFGPPVSLIPMLAFGLSTLPNGFASLLPLCLFLFPMSMMELPATQWVWLKCIVLLLNFIPLSTMWEIVLFFLKGMKSPRISFLPAFLLSLSVKLLLMSSRLPRFTEPRYGRSFCF